MAPTVIAFAPGRVELLGNHTDYNDGVALAAAIDRGVTIRAEKLDADLVEISSETNGREVRVSLKDLQRLDEERWANYPIGVIKTLRAAGFEIGGMRLRVSSNLTPGSGLSSSAAFEVATAVAALELFGLRIEPMALAKLCQKAENDFVGVHSGFLDQAASVFGKEGEAFDQPERMPIDETERIVPGSPYGESKFILERMLYWLDRIHGVRFACMRYFNAAGATATRGEDHAPELHLIPLVLQVAMQKRKSISIFGDDYPTLDGTCVRDYIHVIDLAQAHILALGVVENGSRYYNLGNGEGFSVKQVIDTAREITGKDIPAEVAPRRAGDPTVLVAASDRIRNELGWIPKFPHVSEIIESAWRWHQSYPAGYLQ